MATKKKTNNNKNKYEAVYSELLEFIITLHERNKKRIKYGIIFLFTLPLVLVLIRFFTDGDKVVFLIIWVIIMFLLAIYLIGVEYLDEMIKKKLSDITDKELELDNLLEDSKLRKKLEEFRNLKIKGGSK